MRRLIPILALAFTLPTAFTLARPAFAQSLDGSLNSTLFGNLNSGIQSGFQGGLPSGLGSSQATQIGRFRQDQAFDDDGSRDLLRRRDLERQGVDLESCALTQFDLNRSGCRPLREFSTIVPSTYDLSIRAMAPLTGLTLGNETLSPGAGPAGPLD